MSNWYIGQKVVCIKDFICKNEIKKDLRYSQMIFPEIYSVYTIREMRSNTNELGFRFFEIRNKKMHFSNGFYEASFLEDYFKPLEETNYKIFTDILASIVHKSKELV